MAARIVSEEIPERAALFLGNSMPIRDMDMYASPSGKTVSVAANRGASGIDGNIAAAVGHAGALNALVTVMLGDLAVLHDLNSLALVRQAAVPVVIVALAGYGEAIRRGVAALVDVLQLAGVAANAMSPAEVATSWLAPV